MAPLPLVLEPKVEPLVALVGRGGQILQSLLLAHGSPLLVSLLVAEDIIRLHEAVQDDIHTENAEKLPVSTHVPWFVVCTAGVSPRCMIPPRPAADQKKSTAKE